MALTARTRRPNSSDLYAGLARRRGNRRAGMCGGSHPGGPQQRHVHRSARRHRARSKSSATGTICRPRGWRRAPLGHRRSDRRRRTGTAHSARRAHRQRYRDDDSGQDAASAAREIPRSRRCRAALPAALSRPDHEPAEPRDAAPAQPDRRGDAQLSASSAAISRSRRRCCTRSRAAPRRSPSSPITTRSTSISTCGSRPSCT